MYRCIWKVPHVDAGEKSIYRVNFGGAFGSPKVKIGLGWSEEALYVHLDATPALSRPVWPNYWDGDAVELYVATKNWKESRSLHRFCHTFVALPEPVDGLISAEMTELSQLETRALAKENSIGVRKDATGMTITLPFETLYGWDEDGKAIGFACAIYQESCIPVWWPGDGRPLEVFPSLWAELIMS
jgi:hypothetical protein